MSETNEVITEARRMIGDARGEFWSRIQPFVTDHNRDFAEALSRAIGEVSPDEAFSAFCREALEECFACEGDGFAPQGGGNCPKCSGGGKVPKMIPHPEPSAADTEPRR